MALIAIGRKEKLKEQTAVRDDLPESIAVDDFHISKSAALQIPALVAQEKPSAAGLLRVSIRGGGCSGLTYHYAIVDEKLPNDRVFSRDTATVVIDPKSFSVLGGCSLQYDRVVGKSGFTIRNPNVKGSCSCGQSFARPPSTPTEPLATPTSETTASHTSID